MAKKEATHIRIEPKVKKALDKLKKIPQEPYSSVIETLINDNEILRFKSKGD